MLTEMRMAALVQKSLHGPEVLPALRVLKMATIDGARALGLESFALYGHSFGAIITTNSGAPGGGVQVQLRGTTSIGSSSTTWKPPVGELTEEPVAAD